MRSSEDYAALLKTPCIATVIARFCVVATSSQLESDTLAFFWSRKVPLPPAQFNAAASPLFLTLVKVGETGARLPNNPSVSRLGPAVK